MWQKRINVATLVKFGNRFLAGAAVMIVPNLLVARARWSLLLSFAIFVKSQAVWPHLSTKLQKEVRKFELFWKIVTSNWRSFSILFSSCFPFSRSFFFKHDKYSQPRLVDLFDCSHCYMQRASCVQHKREFFSNTFPSRSYFVRFSHSHSMLSRYCGCAYWTLAGIDIRHRRLAFDFAL